MLARGVAECTGSCFSTAALCKDTSGAGRRQRRITAYR